MLSVPTPEAGKRVLDLIEKHNASLAKGPAATDFPIFARPSLNAVFKRVFKSTRFPAGWVSFVPLLLLCD
jgi:hypothetical protein